MLLEPIRAALRDAVSHIVEVVAESTGIEIAHAVGITEHATGRILVDLQPAGYVELEKVGRRNRYRVDTRQPLGRIGDRDLTVSSNLLELMTGTGSRKEQGRDDGNGQRRLLLSPRSSGG